MIHQSIPPFNKSIRFSREIACALAAASLAVFSILAFWSFEIHSFQKLFNWGVALTVTFFAVLFLAFFRKFPRKIEFDFAFIAGALVASLVFILLALQPDPTDPRALASAGLVFFAFLSFCLFLINPIHYYLGISPLKQIFFFSVLMLGFFGIGILLINGLSVRMYGDDFCYALQRLSAGWIGASLNFYRIWSARFSSNFLLMGLSDKHWAPLAQILAILCSFFLALKRWLYRANPNGWPVIIAAALFIPFAAFSITPDLYKSVYWIVSSVAVLPLLALIPLYFLPSHP